MKRNRVSTVALALCILISGCDDQKEKGAMAAPDYSTLAFTCVHEADRLPPLDPQADIWFKQARAMQKASGAKDFAAIANLYRQAAAKDHYKAMINLQNLLRKGLTKPVAGMTAQEEVIKLTERMMKLNIPSGYYLMGHYLETGYGVKRDKMASLAYFRKSADLGGPEGQYYVGQLFLTEQFEGKTDPKTLEVHFDKNPAYNPDIGKAMLDCSARQGNGEAAYRLALWYSINKTDYVNALKYYQLGVMNGNKLSAMTLIAAFSSPKKSDTGDYLAVNDDPERVRRYTLLKKEIKSVPSARFPDIDKIVPLPPAPLPEWDGTFEYKKEPAQ